ncbi:MAG TPA: glycosyltransferase [Pirellulales bacterium]|jgi:hypothetical protein|nr:glycosyltransferase [Pirellulales bacterium]
MKRVLIVTSGYCPTMTADMHRARMLAFNLPEYGWDVEILAPDTSYQRASSLDRDSEIFFCDTSPVHDVPAWMPRLFRAAGIGTVGWRAWVPMYLEGSRLLASGRFDLVYFSTTHFVLFTLGPIWRARYKVPFVVDLQDPWYRPQQRYFTTNMVCKARVMNWLSKRMERQVVPRAEGIVSVSPTYLANMNECYSSRRGAWQQPSHQAVIPFAASLADLQRARAAMPAATHDGLSDSSGDQLKLVYVGIGGVTRSAGFTALCRVLAELRRRQPVLIDRVRIGLFGTTGGQAMWGEGVLKQIANQHGLSELVQEQGDQVSYFESLRLGLEASGLLILGVDDPGYTPSKLFGYLLFGKPVLACLLGGTPACDFVEAHPEAAALIRFGSTATPLEDGVRVVREFLEQVADGLRSDRSALVAEYLAGPMAQRHAELFDQCLADRQSVRQESSRDRVDHAIANHR